MKEYFTPSSLNRKPTHPGEIIREDILKALKLSITQAAAQLHISRQSFHKILGGTSSITPEMALKLAKFCGNTASFWLTMQQTWDLWHAEKKIKDELALIKRHGAVLGDALPA